MDKLTSSKISELNINITKSSTGTSGVIIRQSFSKMKTRIAPRSKEIPCSLPDKHDNLATTRNEFQSEFKHCLRAREFKPS